MIVIDTKPNETFKNIIKNISIKKPSNQKVKIVNRNLTPRHIKHDRDYVVENMYSKINVWIYNDFNVSSRFWKDFGSRRSKQETYGIIELCIKSLYNNLNFNNYNIRVFDQSDIPQLLPEYNELFKKCNNDYVVYNLIKYSILKKYGGLWIPKDTIMLNDVFSANDISLGNIVTYGKNNTNLYDNLEYSDLILGAVRDHEVINDVVKFIKLNLNTFQNGIAFKNSINKFFNKALINSKTHIHKNLLITNISSKEALRTSHLFSTLFINIEDFSNYSFLNIDSSNINNSVKYSYLLSMSQEQILESNLFLAYLIKISLQ